MGLASSQARMLLLTARKSDLEYRAQMISQRKINLAMQTQTLASNYSQALTDRVMKFTYTTAKGESQQDILSYAGLTTAHPDFVGDYLVKTASGKYAASSASDAYTVALKLANAEGFFNREESVTKFFGPADEKGNATEMSYANLKEQNYLVRGTDAEGKEVYLASSEADQETVAALLAKANGEELTEKNKDDYLSKVVIDKNNYLQSSSSVYNALKGGNISLVQFNAAEEGSEKGEYVPAQYDIEGCTKKVTTEERKVTVDKASSLTGAEKEALLAKYGNEITIVTAMNNAEFFQDALRNGALFLYKKESAEQTGYESLSWSADRNISDVADSSNDAEAEAEYEAKSLVLSNQDKMLDLELNQIETQHKAIETEYDSVKKVIEKNIDVSYKIFA